LQAECRKIIEIFKPNIVRDLLNCKENSMKNECIVKKTFFLIILFENPVPLNMRLRMQLRSPAVEKMTGIFTKRIWQSYCTPLSYTIVQEWAFNLAQGSL